jgi:cell division protein FtsI/penicillin-binding protein 2
LALKTRQSVLIRFVLFMFALAWGSNLLAVTSTKKKKSAKTQHIVPKAATLHVVSSKSKSKKITSGPWRVPNYADSSEGDFIDGEDLTVRRAAVDALGPMNGTVVVTDPSSGRILTIVNQKLAFQSGYQPCSTIKVPVALAALSESIIDRQTLIRVYGRTTFDMTTALAKSNNQYFAALGQRLGFDRVRYYANLFGLGEKAGLDIEQEHAGLLTATVPKTGVGMMTSFGDGISLTPLELAAIMGSIANGGTLYYLQYPKNQAEAGAIIPRVKRRLDIADLIPDVKPGMMGAVEYGTARRIGFDPNEPIYGKTGTCTDSRSPTHLGWFGSFTEVGKNKLVVVVLLTGGRLVSGPTASGVAGQVYKNLGVTTYFTAHQASPAVLAN